MSGTNDQAVVKADERQQRLKPVKTVKKRSKSRMFSQITLLLVVVMCAAMVMIYAAPPGRLITKGALATSTIYAPKDIEDAEATEAARLEAEQKAMTQPIYYDDNAVFESLQTGATEFIDSLDRLRADAESLRQQAIHSAAVDSPLQQFETGALTVDQWMLVLKGDGIEMLLGSYGDLISESQIYNLLSVSETQLAIWLRELTVRFNAYLRRGINDGEQAAVRADFVNEMTSSTPISIRSYVTVIADAFLQPTRFLDQSATERAAALARRNVSPIYIAEGEPIVERGEEITEYKYSLLKQAGYAQTWKDVLPRYLVVAVYYALCAAVIVKLSAKSINDLFRVPSQCTLTLILCALNLAVYYAAINVNPNLNTLYLGALLMAKLVNIPMAVASVFLMAPAAAFMVSGTIVFDLAFTLQVTMATVLGCLAGVLCVKDAIKRSAIFVGSVVCAAAMGVVYAMFGAFTNTAALDVLPNVGWLAAGSVASAILGLGLLPLWEMVFDVATPSRLLEFSDANHPLLRRLMLEAPGTYQHSMLVANIADGCATAIGANSMLARVGAYFHDIGKLKRPAYFLENQPMGENPHDQLDAETSVAIITAHVRDGVAMAKQNKLPTAVREIISQHHGNTLVAMFYYKAVKELSRPDLPMDSFRYPGSRPYTRESAIVMLCDSVEAAVRSIDDKTEQSVYAMIDKIILSKIEDGQLGVSALTTAELEKIRQAMRHTLGGTFHHRAAYPDIKALKAELERTTAH